MYETIIGSRDNCPPGALRSELEGAIREFGHVRDVITNRLPPAFALMEVMLEAPSHRMGADELVTEAERRLDQLAAVALSLEGWKRRESILLYRRVLYEACSSDMLIDGSERALLGVLRRELNIRDVEHFILAHHPDFRGLWTRSDAVVGHLASLRQSGLIFHMDEDVIIPSDLVPRVRRVMGLELPRAANRRFLGFLTVRELQSGLERCGVRVAGSKDERLDRLVDHLVQPSEIAAEVGLDTLREICRDHGWPATGNKDEVLRRVTEGFASNSDLASTQEVLVQPAPPPEPRQLGAMQFRVLFEHCTGQELREILVAKESSRVSGTKSSQIDALWQSRFSEASLLAELSVRQLVDVSERVGVRGAGAKAERIRLLLQWAG